MTILTFKNLADFIRQFAGIPNKTRVSPSTQVEKDLGITNDDGIELLEAVEKQFGITPGNDISGIREPFKLGPNEYLFHSEGWDFPLWWFGLGQKPVVRAFTVGELYTVLQTLRTT